MELLEINDVLPILKCNEQTFRSWLDRGNLPKDLVLRIGRTIRIRKAILDKWLCGEL